MARLLKLRGVLLALASSRIALATEAAAPTNVAVHRLRGPYARLEDFCRELRSGGRLRCSSPLTPLDQRGRLGARIEQAQLVPLLLARGPRPVEVATALKVQSGWFVDTGGAEARAATPNEARVEKQTVTAEWLDHVGAGVLGISVTRTGEFRRVIHQGNETDELSTELDESDRRFCGLDVQGAPTCTSELLERSYGCLDARQEQSNYAAELELDGGVLAVHADGKPAASCSFGAALADGRYALPFAGIPAPAERAAGVLQGPYPSIDSYCRSIRRGSREACLLETGPWDRAVAVVGAQAHRPRTRLLRVKGDVAGLRVEYCRLGVETLDGWYFTADDTICRGTFGDMATVETGAESLAWIAASSMPAFVVTTRRREERGEYLDSRQEQHRAVGVVIDEVKRAELCLLPPNGAPRCGPNYVVGCKDPDGNWREAHWSLSNGALVFSASQRAECDFGGVLGSVVGETDE